MTPPCCHSSNNRPEFWPRSSTAWDQRLTPQFESCWWISLQQYLAQERRQYQVFPAAAQVFQAFHLTPLEEVKFVILGQDPYHGARQAHGLSFSVPDGVPTPPSLANIFKELSSDLGLPAPASGNLGRWAQRGGLLLNSVLTVRAGAANSHRNCGWENFTDAVIELVNEDCNRVAFILWGAAARRKAKLIDSSRHLVLESAHPSPLSAYRGFFGSQPFSSINRYRLRWELPPINWDLSGEANELGE